MKNKFVRQLIEIEIRLGFLNIPSNGIEIMPSSDKIDLVVDGEIKEFTYNPKYRRIFGLTDWYRKLEAESKDFIELVKTSDRIYEIKLIKFVKEEKSMSEIKEKAAGLSSQAKGNIVEDRIKEILTLGSQGRLSVYKPVTDTEGIDFIIARMGQYAPIFIQVKGRFNLHQDRSLIISVSRKTFTSDPNFYVIGAYFDLEKGDIDDNILLIPSKDLEELATIVNSGEREFYRVVPSLVEGYRGKWIKYLIKKSELAEKLIGHFEKERNVIANE